MKIFYTIAKGMVMGAADIVPGVSGGTLAFIMGFYERLIRALSHLDHHAIRLLLTRQWRSCWAYIDGAFLALLFTGIVISIFTLSHAVHFFLEHYPVYLWCFFNGLIIASLPQFFRDIQWTWTSSFSLVVGVLFAIWLAFLPEAQYALSGHIPWYIFLGSGFIAICAMILPGISGSFILLVLGMYAPATAAVKNLEFSVIFIFASGCFLGLVCFSKLLKWALARYYSPIFAGLVGIIMGSFIKIWPWSYTGLQAETPLPSCELASLQSGQLVLPTTYQHCVTDFSYALAAVSFLGALGVISLIFKLSHTQK